MNSPVRYFWVLYPTALAGSSQITVQTKKNTQKKKGRKRKRKNLQDDEANTNNHQQLINIKTQPNEADGNTVMTTEFRPNFLVWV